MKRFRLVLLVISLLSASSLKAYDFEIDGIYYEVDYNSDDYNYVLVAGYNSSQYLGSVVIPDSVSYGGKVFRVVGIDNSAFSGCSSLTSVTFPEGLKTIDNSAFSDCSSLTSVTFPEGLETIGSSAFYGCSSLTSVTFPEGLKTIGSSAFYGCSSLTSVTFPEGLKTIGSKAFDGCISLTMVTFPEGLETIGFEAFRNCISLTSVTFPEGLKTIDDSAFWYCTSLTSVTFPEGLKTIGYGAFEMCTSLTSVTCKSTAPPLCNTGFSQKIIVWVPDGCKNAYSSTSPWNAYYIVDGEGFAVAVHVDLPGTLGEEILKHAEYLRDVNYLTVSGSLNESDCELIKNQMSLLSVDLSETNLTSLSPRMFYGMPLMSAKLPNTLCSIDDYAFFGTHIKDIVIPDQVTVIGDHAFYGCSSLTSVIFPEGLETIDELAFSGCRSLTSVTIPEGLKTIGGGTFEGCSSLTSVTFPEGLKTIGGSAFYGCSSLTSVTFPEGLKTIGGSAFYGCSSLTAVNFPEGLETIGYGAFANCLSLRYVSLPSSLIGLGSTDMDSYSIITGCDSVVVECKALFPPASAGPIVSSSAMSVLYVPAWTINKYKLSNGWSGFKEILPDSNIWPRSIMVSGEAVLEVPQEGMPDMYKPNMYMNGLDGLYLKGSDSLCLNTLEMSWTDAFLADSPVAADSIVVKTEASSYDWHFLSFPYDVKLSEVSTEGQWVVREYDGLARANAEYDSAWKSVDYEGILQAGKGYIWNGTKGDFIVPAMDNDSKYHALSNKEKNVELNEYTSAQSVNSGWNLIGNPYPCYYDTRFMDYTAPITVWDNSDYYETYVAYSPIDDDYILSPFEAFFVQCPTGVESINFAIEGRQINSIVRDVVSLKSATHRQVINLVLSDGKHSDRTRIVINEASQLNYELGRDAAKFMSTNPSVAQLYSLVGEDKLAINERPMSDGEISLGMYIGIGGNYTISMKEIDVEAYLIDHLRGVTTDLTIDDYDFESESGYFTDRFTLVLKDASVTSIETPSLFNKFDIQMHDGVIEVLSDATQHIILYNVSGMQMASVQDNYARFTVEPGVYVVKVGSELYKVSVIK